MAQSPGHQKWPDHKVSETPVKQWLQVEVDGEIIADSSEIIVVDEDRRPKRLYFPRVDVKAGVLQPSDTRSSCPFKGEASYFHLEVGGQTLKDAAWSYENPYQEHEELKDRVVFYDDKRPAIQVRSVP